MAQFNPGDVVQLKSGGPRMTVDTVEAGPIYKCVWFEGEKGKQVKREAPFGEHLLREPPGIQMGVV